jgi:hypothetical protein
VSGRSPAVLLVALAAVACRERAAPAAPSACFVDVTATSGVDFRHRHGGAGEKQLPEQCGGAVAVLDFDGDGKLDLFFPQGGPMPKFEATGVDFRDRMFRGLGGGRFEDVTDAVGCSEPGYSYGAAAADWDGDGDPDLLVCNYGRNTLLRNDREEGRVRFTDVTEQAGVADRAWSSCAAFADFDRDGDLDVYVGNYVVYDEQHPIFCGDQARGPEWRSYCHPDEFKGAQDQLLRNDGNGRFTDVTVAAGMERSAGKCLGVLVLDAEGDGDADVFVANDSTPNFLWRNDSSGGELRFTDVADQAGVGVSANGLSQACMGIDAADVDLDGDFDVVLTNLDMQYNTLYRNDGDGFFSDRSLEQGMEPSIPFVGFGARFLDVDRDGDEDLVIINGHVIDNIALYKPSQTFAQPAHLYWNGGRGRFQLAGDEAGPWFRERHVGRALATLDWDDDGDLDLVVVDNDGKAALLENRREPQGRWFGVRLRGKDANRDAIGALVTISAGGRVLRREQRGTCSYNAFVDLRLLFGIGDAAKVDYVEVRWPRGGVKRVESPPIDAYLEIAE